MATIQQLEKLHHIQRLFYVEDSLEGVVAGERVTLIVNKTEQLIRQRAFLREERRRLRVSSERLEERKRALKMMRQADWLPHSLQGGAGGEERHVKINIAGLMFEIPISIMKRDANSLLAQLCEPDPPLLMDAEGFFYFDRDWWLFRYIVTFLRDGTLPEDRALLAQLYREAGFWHLLELQRAIEENKLHLRIVTTKEEAAKAAQSSSSNPNAGKEWWRKLPSWQQSVQAAAEAEAAKKKKEDWWTATSYKGKTYLPLSKDPNKIVTKPGEKDVEKLPENTWYVESQQGDVFGGRERTRNSYNGPSSYQAYVGGGGYGGGGRGGDASRSIDYARLQASMNLGQAAVAAGGGGGGGGILSSRAPPPAAASSSALSSAALTSEGGV